MSFFIFSTAQERVQQENQPKHSTSPALVIPLPVSPAAWSRGNIMANGVPKQVSPQQSVPGPAICQHFPKSPFLPSTDEL